MASERAPLQLAHLGLWLQLLDMASERAPLQLAHLGLWLQLLDMASGGTKVLVQQDVVTCRTHPAEMPSVEVRRAVVRVEVLQLLLPATGRKTCDCEDSASQVLEHKDLALSSVAKVLIGDPLLCAPLMLCETFVYFQDEIQRVAVLGVRTCQTFPGCQRQQTKPSALQCCWAVIWQVEFSSPFGQDREGN